jgi:hypothetical protein
MKKDIILAGAGGQEALSVAAIIVQAAAGRVAARRPTGAPV